MNTLDGVAHRPQPCVALDEDRFRRYFLHADHFHVGHRRAACLQCCAILHLYFSVTSPSPPTCATRSSLGFSKNRRLMDQRRFLPVCLPSMAFRPCSISLSNARAARVAQLIDNIGASVMRASSRVVRKRLSGVECLHAHDTRNGGSPPSGPRRLIVVAGTGPAGLIAALALSRAGFTVTLAGPEIGQNDLRTTALMAPALELLDGLGVGEAVRAKAAPLDAMRIIDATSRLIRSPVVTFRASEIGEPHFGLNIPNRDLNAILADAVSQAPTIHWLKSLVADWSLDDRPCGRHACRWNQPSAGRSPSRLTDACRLPALPPASPCRAERCRNRRWR